MEIVPAAICASCALVSKRVTEPKRPTSNSWVPSTSWTRSGRSVPKPGRSAAKRSTRPCLKTRHPTAAEATPTPKHHRLSPQRIQAIAAKAGWPMQAFFWLERPLLAGCRSRGVWSDFIHPEPTHFVAFRCEPSPSFVRGQRSQEKVYPLKLKEGLHGPPVKS